MIDLENELSKNNIREFLKIKNEKTIVLFFNKRICSHLTMLTVFL